MQETGTNLRVANGQQQVDPGTCDKRHPLIRGSSLRLRISPAAASPPPPPPPPCARPRAHLKAARASNLASHAHVENTAHEKYA
ncbi:unnamed protein product, partial [Iphiclides podalirius]